MFIGTGLIGAGLAEAALGRGEAVTVWNRTRAKARPLADLGAVLANTLADAVQGQARIHLALTSDEAVDQVLEGVAPELESDAIVIDHSTTSVEGTRARAQRCRAARLGYLHAPVFMSPVGCREGTGMMLVCGPRSLVAHVQAELEQMTGTVRDLGPRPEAAAAFKLVGNGLILSMLGGLADLYTMAGTVGFSAVECQQMLSGFDLGFVVAGRGERMARGDFDTQWSLRMARKDVGLMLDAVGSAPLSVLPALAERMDALIAQGEGEADVGVVGRDAVKGEGR